MQVKEWLARYKNPIIIVALVVAVIINIAEGIFVQSDYVRTLVVYESVLTVLLFLFFLWLVKNEKDAAKVREEFIGMASHELKTPLTAIKMQADILKNKMKDPDQIKMTSNMLVACERMSTIINGLLDTTKVRLGKLTVYKTKTDIIPIIKKINRQLEMREINLIAPEALVGQFDKDRVAQIYENILTNAIKFGQGKPIEIGISVEEEIVKIKVKDLGVGISTEDQRQIFQPFKRVGDQKQFEGSGVGLHIASEIAKSHGGTVTVESEPGRGSVFTISIPIA